MSNIPNLEFLNLSSNQLNESVLESSCAEAFSRVRRLVLNNTQVSWDTVHTISREMPEYVANVFFLSICQQLVFSL